MIFFTQYKLSIVLSTNLLIGPHFLRISPKILTFLLKVLGFKTKNILINLFDFNNKVIIN
jgi:hypothetical protein